MKRLNLLSLFSFRWPARPAISVCAAPMLLGALVLTGCGGDDTSPAPAPQAELKTAKTAPAIPVTPQPMFAASGAGSYQEAVQNYNRVGEVLHAQ